MITVDHVADYPRPPAAVFAVIADPARFPEWQTDVLESHASGPLGEGVRVDQVRKVMGRRTEIGLTVSGYVPGASFTLSTPPEAKPGVSQSYRLHEIDGGCRVEFHLELRGVPKMAEHLVRAQLGKQVPQLFDRLGGLL
ncbi:SRPBCC family protein [Nonomuraea rhodomycinica]|uniref:SRPBCC family protein n=1 Tax=Nonomuraea rhodomycinica TaxID=1712872 RepID=A0A7Y6IMZ1_9ACTN|nr:SRPBCC family protein [Nonomuraea rhodomycinica]NUW41145.1 SRPBCC family protein [Nonomuraea rhodomycinica]